jgi:hypothetical protein
MRTALGPSCTTYVLTGKAILLEETGGTWGTDTTCEVFLITIGLYNVRCKTDTRTPGR